jgi:hypothetical protein
MQARNRYDRRLDAGFDKRGEFAQAKSMKHARRPPAPTHQDPAISNDFSSEARLYTGFWIQKRE